MVPRNPDAFRYDFAVYDRSGHVTVLLEAKRKVATDPSWAREWHSMIVERTAVPNEAQIVLVALDRLYGWRPGAGASAPPDWTVDAREMLRPYFERLHIEPTRIEPRLFEEVVGLWLRDVAQGRIGEEAIVSGARDVISAIREGEIVERAAA
ncbi:MAG TPA: hypothetical protein VIV60_24475 [Polyangiaceae bacterium]